jgi:hypothetical protein
VKRPDPAKTQRGNREENCSIRPGLVVPSAVIERLPHDFKVERSSGPK